MNWNDQEEVKKYFREYKKQNQEKYKAYQRTYREKNRKLLNEKSIRWRIDQILKEIEK